MGENGGRQEYRPRSEAEEGGWCGPEDRKRARRRSRWGDGEDEGGRGRVERRFHGGDGEFVQHYWVSEC